MRWIADSDFGRGLADTTMRWALDIAHAGAGLATFRAAGMTHRRRAPRERLAQIAGGDR